MALRLCLKRFSYLRIGYQDIAPEIDSYSLNVRGYAHG